MTFNLDVKLENLGSKLLAFSRIAEEFLSGPADKHLHIIITVRADTQELRRDRTPEPTRGIYFSLTSSDFYYIKGSPHLP